LFLQLYLVTFAYQINEMGTKEKLVDRFKSQPKDFTFEELVRLFRQFDFDIGAKGKTSDSRIEFINEERSLSYGVHKPHPANTIKSYVMKQVLEFLIENNFIDKLYGKSKIQRIHRKC